MKTGNALRLKSFEFAKRIIKLNEYLRKTHHAYTIADQILRSGTAIGAMIREAEFGESKKDFVHKLHVSLKETNETIYWLELIYSVDYISKIMFDSMLKEVTELLKMLISSIKTLKGVTSS